MIRESMRKIWIFSQKNITLYFKKGPVLIFGLMFPFFMALSWVIGKEISLNQVFVGIISMTTFFTATAISPVILPIETREKSLERILISPTSINEILFGIILASSLYSFIITLLIAIIFIIFGASIVSFSSVFLMILGIGLMATLGSMLALLISAVPTDTTSNIMTLMNLIKFPLLFLGGIFIPLENIPSTMIFLSFISPLTFLTDLLRFCVDGNSFFTPYFDIIMLFVWIVILLYLNIILHKKTMPKRFSETGKKKKKNKTKKK
ncbi:MAG: ABC transporter permease [Promethearchaeota archaeon]